MCEIELLIHCQMAAVWESYFIPHYIMFVITYPYKDKSYYKLVKGALVMISFITP